jgi:benzoyl-CoA reductase/2-hydroxyglutaryl-CoA dehydratase subunit BcrC/BadD/HgdB
MSTTDTPEKPTYQVSTSDIVNLLRDTNNNIMELVAESGKTNGKIEDIGKTLDENRTDLRKLESGQRRLEELISSRMTPDRCALFHEEIETRMAEKIGKIDQCKTAHKNMIEEFKKDIKEGAKGWVKNTLVMLKVAALLAAIFGGSALGAQMLGLLKSGSGQ